MDAAARAQLQRRHNSQLARVLANLALLACAPDDAATLVSSWAVWDDDDPTLAATAYALGPLDGTRLRLGVAHAWPEVQAAAIARVQGPCTREVHKLMQRVLARSPTNLATRAVEALGRCQGKRAYRMVRATLDWHDAEIVREYAARVLAGDFSDTTFIADVLERMAHNDPLAPRLIRAIERASSLDYHATQQLCRDLNVPFRAQAARRTLDAFEDGISVCDATDCTGVGCGGPSRADDMLGL